MTHVVLIVMLKFFIKNTHGLAYVAFTNISSRLWLGDNAIWHILSIKEIYQVFIQAYNLLLLDSKTFKGANNIIWPILSFQKKKRKNCIRIVFFTSQNFYQETTLKYFMQVSIKSSIHFFFSIYNILEKFESGTVWVDPYYPLKIKRSIFVKSSYGSNYIAFLDIYI